MEIRAFTEADAARFWALRLRALREHPGAFAASYEEARDRPLASVAEELRVRNARGDSVIRGAFVGGDPAPVGMIGCFRQEGAKRRHKAMIWGMYVAPEVRRQGAGRLLLEAAIAGARAWPGVRQIHLGVMTENREARALYRAAGFTVYGVEPRSLRLGDRYLDEEHMVLDLERVDADR